jgi:transcriptional antiterminator RfaH
MHSRVNSDVLIMDLWRETNWFAVQSKPFREALAAASLAKLDLEVFFPKVEQEQLVCGVWRIVIRPLFAGYFFARLCPLLSLDAVRYARGVLRVVGSSAYPIPIDAEVVAAIRERVQADGLIRLEPKPLCQGDTTAIEQGPFAGWMGKVEG